MKFLDTEGLKYYTDKLLEYINMKTQDKITNEINFTEFKIVNDTTKHTLSIEYIGK